MFIVGSPRSGTTLLASLLELTPWGSPFETHFIPKYFETLSGDGLASRPAFTHLAGQILRERPVAQHQLRVTPDELYDSVPEHDYASLVDAICRRCGRRHGHESWGDKTPHYINHVDLLHGLFPRSKMIYIVRDGRDVALSLLKKPWGPANMYMCALKWRDENRLQPILDTLRTAGLLHDLRYEDLLQDPAACVSRIYSFLGHDVAIDELERMVSIVERRNAGKWARGAAPEQTALFEQVAGETLARFGYPVSRPVSPVHPLAASAYRLHDSVKHAKHLFVMNVVDTIKIRYFGMEPFAQ